MNATSSRIKATILLCLSFAGVLLLPFSAKAQHCNPIVSLEDYLAIQVKPSEGTVIIAFDHRRQPSWWQGFRWNGTHLDPLGPAVFDLDAEDRPRLHLPNHQNFQVYIVGTDPLVYILDPGASSEADRDDLANLETLVTLLGGQFSGVFTIVGEAQAQNALSGRITDSVDENVAGEDLDFHDFHAPLPSLPATSIPIEVRQSLIKISTTVDARLSDLKKALGDVRRGFTTVEKELTTFQRRSGEAESYVRAVETASPIRPSFDWPSVTTLEEAIDGYA